MSRESKKHQIENLIEQAVVAKDLELVDLRVVKRKKETLFQVIVDSKEGIGIEECSKVSRELKQILDGSAWTGPYALEVSSPGVERPLTKLSDFKRFQHRRVFIKVREKIKERKQFSGVIESVNSDMIVLMFEGSLVEIPYEMITKAHLIVTDEELFSSK